MGEAKRKQQQKLAVLQERKMRYSLNELSLIKSTFSKNIDVLMTLRKFMFQGDMTEDENKIIKDISTKETVDILRKTFVPEINPEAPFGQIVDLYAVINVKEATVEYVNYQISSCLIIIDYLNQQLDKLEGKKSSNLKLKDLSPNKDKTPEQNFVDLYARSWLIGHIEGQIQQLQSLAVMIEETPAEQAARFLKDSSQ